MYLTIGFVISCALCAYEIGEEYRWYGLAVSAAAALVCFVVSRESKTLQKVALIFLGITAGLFWFERFDCGYLAPAKAMDGQITTASIRIADYSRKTDYGISADGWLLLEKREYQVRVYLNDPVELEPGQILCGTFRFRTTAPGAPDESEYYQGKGIFLVASQKGDYTLSQPIPTWRDYPAIIRRQILGFLEEAFDSDTAPFAKALLLGDTSDLSYRTDTAFKLSGVRHMIAVSGLHVSILFTLVSGITFRKRFLTALVGFPVLALFAAAAGFTPSVVRACLMSGLMLLSSVCSREYDGPTALSFSVLIMLVCNPLVITSVGLQLSASSVAGIFLFEPGMRKWMRSRFGQLKGKTWKGRLVSWLTSSVSSTLSAQVLTVPLCAAYFGTVSLVSVFSNLLILWLVGGIFYGIMAVCLLGTVWPLGSMILQRIVSVLIRGILFATEKIAEFPLACVYTRSPYIAAWLVVAYLLLGVYLLMKNKKPAIFFGCVVTTLCISLLASWIEPMASDVRFTVLDVGQGQCLLFQSEGRTCMIDCGGDSDSKTADIAAEALLSQGITKLDTMILTHYDRDHAGAVSNFLSRMDTGLLILPASAGGPEVHGGEVVYAEQTLKLSWGDTNITIYPATFPGNSNENSLCILFDTKKCVILVTGDRNGFGERSLMRQTQLPDVDILVAGHHGSANSTCDELLAQVQPEIVCISAGADNSYGHPSPQLLQRLETFGCTIYRTDLHGTIMIRR